MRTKSLNLIAATLAQASQQLRLEQPQRDTNHDFAKLIELLRTPVGRLVVR
jgi:hypothetical protein